MATGGSFEDGTFLGQYREALHRLGSAKAAMENTEKRRKAAFSRLVDGSTLAVAKAEHAATCHPNVLELDKILEGLRVEVAEADAEVTWMAARLDVWRTRQSTYREQLKRESSREVV